MAILAARAQLQMFCSENVQRSLPFSVIVMFSVQETLKKSD